jgi:hypothetical protein
MIIVSKTERDRIASAFPHVHIVRAKHHYYCEEDRRVLRMLGREGAADNKDRGGNKRKPGNRKWRYDD